MTSRLTLSALVFSILSTTVLVWTAEADANTTSARATQVVQLERVTIVAPRLAPQA